MLASVVFCMLVASASADDILTRLVLDFKANPKDYLNYINTATASIPEDLTSLALQVRTYTDDSYTTLLDSKQIGQVLSFISDLPWHTRLEDSENAANASGSDGATLSAAPSVTATTSSGNHAGRALPYGAGLAALAVALL